MPSPKKNIDNIGSPPELVKKVPSKNAAASKEYTPKYLDKSAGQPEIVVIFETIKQLLKPYAKDHLKEQEGKAGMYNIISTRPVELLGKVRELFFASVMVQKGYVGFYYFPIYTNPEIANELEPELLQCLKGKSCFHIRKKDAILIQQIEKALEVGYRLYKEKGYV